MNVVRRLLFIILAIMNVPETYIFSANDDAVLNGSSSATVEMEPTESVKDAQSHPAYLGEFLNPWEHSASQEPVEFLFDNAELSVLLQYVEQIFNITFILDDNISPLPQGAKSILGTKISFRTHKPLARKEAWDLFVTFLDMAGLAPAPGPAKGVYRLLQSQDPKAPQSVTRAPLPTFVGVDPALLPDDDVRIRYVYFVANSSLDVIKNVIDMIKSATSPNLMILPELNAIIMTDKSANIKAILAMVKEIDQANLPEALALVKLTRTDAIKAAQLYEALVKKEAQGLAARILGARRQSTTEYFHEGTRVIPEPRTNSLIILGSHESIKKIVDFMKDIVDKQDALPEIPLYIYRLKFLDAESIASILQQATQFQQGTEAAKSGGVRDGDKYLKQVSITPEKTTNSLVINADYEDYSKIHELLIKLDVEQPQVALKVFILNIDLTDDKGFGAQIRNKKPGVSGLIGNDTNFQTSGLNGTNSGIVENTSGTGATRLLGDLVTLASGITTLGSTVISMGSDKFGVWGILNMLETHTRTSLIANPFLVTTHKYPAQFSIGEKRYVLTSTVFTTSGPQQTFGFVDANLVISITPQITKDDLIGLNVKIALDQFEDANINSTNGNRTSKRIETSVIVADNDVLALGGLLKETKRVIVSSVPLLGSIPVLKWLFTNKTTIMERNSILILIVAEIIQPAQTAVADAFTKDKVLDSQDLIDDVHKPSDMRDPVHRWFFHDGAQPEKHFVKTFIQDKGRYVTSARDVDDIKLAAIDTKSIKTEQVEAVSQKSEIPQKKVKKKKKPLAEALGG